MDPDAAPSSSAGPIRHSQQRRTASTRTPYSRQQPPARQQVLQVTPAPNQPKLTEQSPSIWGRSWGWAASVGRSIAGQVSSVCRHACREYVYRQQCTERCGCRRQRSHLKAEALARQKVSAAFVCKAGYQVSGSCHIQVGTCLLRHLKWELLQEQSLLQILQIQ